MKNVIIGVIIGIVLGGGIGYAAAYRFISLQEASTGIAISSSNPLPISNF